MLLALPVRLRGSRLAEIDATPLSVRLPPILQAVRYLRAPEPVRVQLRSVRIDRINAASPDPHDPMLDRTDGGRRKF